MSRIIDRTGKIYGNWTVIKKTNRVNSGGEAVWLCRCSCGKYGEVVGGNLTNGCSRRCLQCGFDRNYKTYVLPPPVWIEMVKNSRHNRKKIGLSREFVEALFIKQKGLCALTGQPIRFASNNREDKRILQTASLDRIDSSKPYTTTNVHWVHKEINIMKNKYTLAKFIENCKLVVDHHNQHTT